MCVYTYAIHTIVECVCVWMSVYVKERERECMCAYMLSIQFLAVAIYVLHTGYFITIQSILGDADIYDCMQAPYMF